MKLEFERTFLVHHLPSGFGSAPRVEIEDYYFPPDSGRPRLRARRSGETYELTKKEMLSDAAEHAESSISLDAAEFGAITVGAIGVIRKMRIRMALPDILAELDIFQHKLQGLVLAEFEFTDRASLERFVPPTFCMADVTHEFFVAGGLLVGKTFADLEPDLRRFGYRPIRLGNLGP